MKVFTLVKDMEQETVILLSESDVTSYDRDSLWTDIEKRGNGVERKMLHDTGTASHQQLVAFAWRSAVEIEVAGTGLTEQVLADDAAKCHRLHIPAEKVHHLLAADSEHAAGHHRLNGGQRRAAIETTGIVAHELTGE